MYLIAIMSSVAIAVIASVEGVRECCVVLRGQIRWFFNGGPPVVIECPL